MSILRQAIVTHFSEDELKALCLDLGVNYDALPGSGTAAKALELVHYLQSRQQVPKLLTKLRDERPNVAWDVDEAELAAISDEIARKERPNVDIGTIAPSGSATVVVGDNTSTTINQGVGKAALAVIVGVVVILVVGAVGFTVTSLQPTPTPAPRPTPTAYMRKAFNIAFAPFTVQGEVPASESDPSGAIAARAADRVRETLQSSSLAGSFEVWGPEQFGPIAGDTVAARAQAIAKRASEIDAHVVVYGSVDTRSTPWLVQPEFYVSTETFTRAAELVGHNELGTPLVMFGQGSDPGESIRANDELNARIQALSKIVLGLSAYHFRRYDEALAHFQAAAEVPGWGDSVQQPEGKHIVHHFIGNAALQLRNFDLAEQAFAKALEFNPEYARTYVSLGVLNRLRALLPAAQTNPPDLTKVDEALIRKAISMYERARTAKDKPPLADIEPKVDFGLGECYLTLAQARRADTFEDAAAHYRAVIQAYAEGANERLKELAADSHARLGQIYRTFRRFDEAADSYDRAASLLSGSDSYLYDPARAALFTGLARDIRATASAAPAADAPAEPAMTPTASP